MDNLYTRVLCGIFIADFTAVIGSSVVYGKKFPIGKGLILYTLNSPANVIFDVVNRHYNTNFYIIHSL